MARVGYLADNFGVFPASMPLTADAIMGKSGLNIGNFAFWNAIQLLLDEEIILFPFAAKADNYIGKLDFIVIPAANWLSAGLDFGWLADFIEGVNVPCLIFGLGAQSASTQSFPPLKEGTKRLLKAISKRTPFLAVRGEYTKKLCNSLGIDNVQALGCPSILTSPNKQLGKVISQKWSQKADKVALHGLNLTSNTKNAEQYLYHLLNKFSGSSYIIQEPRELIRLMTQEGLAEGDQAVLNKVYNQVVKKGYLDQLLKKRSFKHFTKKMRESAYVPFSLNSWVYFVSYHSHSLGTRIHGSIVSLTAEIPTICITHDTRTQELCEIMKIPYLKSDLDFQAPLEDFFSCVKIDTDFDANRMALATKNAALITQAGLKISPHLKSLL